MESPSAFGTKPHAAFPLTLNKVSSIQALCGLRVKLQFVELKFSVNVTRFCEKPNGIISMNDASKT
jgi:hypothetical protein